MPDIYIVIGDANARKSSTLRCLTGFSGRSPFKKRMKIATATGTIEVLMRLAALQEGPRGKSSPPHVYSPKDFTACSFERSANVVIALRVHGTRDCAHPALDYLQHLCSKQGWNIRQVALLGDAAMALRQTAVFNALFLGQVTDIPAMGHGKATDEPSNRIAAQLRSHWQWV